MHVKHLVAAGAASGILALGAVPAAAFPPPAHADDVAVIVQPEEVVPGGLVTVFTTDCDDSNAVASSAAFAAPIKLKSFAGMTGGIGWIGKHASPGHFQVTVTCGPKTLTGWCDVVSSKSPFPPPPPPMKPQPQPILPPPGGVATGDGASQASATSGLGSTVALATVAAGVAVLMLRRRRSGGGS